MTHIIDDVMIELDKNKHAQKRFEAYSKAQGNDPAVQYLKDSMDNPDAPTTRYIEWVNSQAEMFASVIEKRPQDWNVRDHVHFTNYVRRPEVV